MFILYIVTCQRHILIFDWTANGRFIDSENTSFSPDLSARVGPDLAAAHIEGDEEEQDRNLCPQGKVIEVCVQAPYHREQNHEELQQSDRHDDKVDGRCVDFLVDLASFVNKSKIMPVDEVL